MINTEDTKNIFIGNGSTTSFPFAWKLNAVSDLLVLLYNDKGERQAPLVLNTHYSVTLNGNQNTNPGGTVTYPISGPALPTGWRLVVARNMPELQPVDYQHGLRPQLLESQDDNAIMLIQQLSERVGRALKTSIADPVADMEIPRDRAGKYLAFDSQGEPMVLPIVVPGSVGAYISVKDFGAKGDGVTDDTAAIKTAFVAAEAIGLKYLVFNGVFKVTAPLDVPEGMTIDLSSGVINATEFVDSGIGNNPDPVFRVFGTEAGGTELAADASAYGWSITVSDASDIDPGDLLFIQSNQLWYTEGTNSVGRMTMAKARAVSGATVTLSWPLPMDFDATSYTVTVTVIKPKRGVTIMGGEIIGPGYQGPKGNNVGPAAVHAAYFEGLKLQGTIIRGFQGSGVRTHLGMDVSVVGVHVYGHADDYNDPIVEGQNSGFYGLFFDRTRAVRVVGSYGYRTRHFIDSAFSEDAQVIGCQAYDNHQNAFTCHMGSTDWVFSGCSDFGARSSFQWRGHSVTVDGCTFDSLSDDVLGSNAIYDTAGSANDIPKRYVFTNNRLRSTRAGVLLFGTIGTALIHDNIILGSLQNIYPIIHINSDCSDVVSIRGNHLEAINPSGVNYAIRAEGSATSRKLIRVEGNTIGNYTSQALRVTATDGETVVIFKDNYLLPNGATAHFLIQSGTPLYTVTGPNYLSSGAPYGMEKLAQLQIAPGSSVSPEANGDVVLELTNNTTLTVKAKGSDSNIRTGTITLSP